MLRQQARRIIAIDPEIDELMIRPRHAQIFYRTGARFWLVNGDGSGNLGEELAEIIDLFLGQLALAQTLLQCLTLANNESAAASRSVMAGFLYRR